MTKKDMMNTIKAQEAAAWELLKREEYYAVVDGMERHCGMAAGREHARRVCEAYLRSWAVLNGLCELCGIEPEQTRAAREYVELFEEYCEG